MKIKFIKLINNERIKRKLTASKACDSTSVDSCIYEDNAHCKVYAYDECGKDYAACTQGADDYCEQRDSSSDYCHAPGIEDTKTEPY